RLEVHGDDARASTGIGPLRWSKRFKVLEVTDVKVGIQTGKNSQRHIAIEGVKTVKFGSLLSEERMYWMASSAVVLLLTPDSPEVSQLIALGGGQNGVQL